MFFFLLSSIRVCRLAFILIAHYTEYNWLNFVPIAHKTIPANVLVIFFFFCFRTSCFLFSFSEQIVNRIFFFFFCHINTHFKCISLDTFTVLLKYVTVFLSLSQTDWCCSTIEKCVFDFNCFDVCFFSPSSSLFSASLYLCHFVSYDL